MKYQSPRGTRDFYPADMAWRNHLTDAWRRVSIRNGFEQVDGPVYESLDLYKAKSGEGIVSELFHFEDRGGRELAIRPEFTPTLARMVAAKANSLPKPIKWFCTPNLCRAERPQRGRVREHWQWNIDMLGVEDASADAEVIATAVDFFQSVGLEPTHLKFKLSHREVVKQVLARLGVPDDKMLEAFALLDRRDKIPQEEFTQGAVALGLDEYKVERFQQMCRRKYPAGDVDHLARSLGMEGGLDDLHKLDDQLQAFGLADWCEYDLGIVRGLAYYTGTVFEVHEVSGAERAVAGGGRYDKLIELFGGPPTPAVGFGMGDVVISLVMQDKGLIPDSVEAIPDVYLIAASDAAAQRIPGLATSLRQQGIHARFSYKSTRNVGKLLKEAAACNARFAVIVEDDAMQLKDLQSGEQRPITNEELPGVIDSA